MGWKAAQSRVRTRKFNKLAFLVIGIVVAIIVLGYLVRFIKFFWGQGISWDGKTNIYLVAKTSSTSIFTYKPREKEIIIVNIPDETYIDTALGYGRWKVGSLFGLGGQELVDRSLSSLLGLPIDGNVRFEGNYQNKNPQQIIDTLRSSPFGFTSLMRDIKTNLSPPELWRIYLSLLRVRFDKISYFDLKDLKLLDKVILADGTAALVADPIKIDGFIESKFADATIKEEASSVAVFNGTNHPGLAQKAARIIINSGGNVIIQSNLSLQVKKSFVFSLPKQKTFTEKRLASIFVSPSCQHDPECATLNEYLTSSRAQINVILGEDFYEKVK